MRVITMGSLPEETLYKGTCSNCKTVFECKEKEGNIGYENPRDGGEKFITVDCPLCRKKARAYPRKDGALIPPHADYDDRRVWERNTSYYGTPPGNLFDRVQTFADR